MADTPSDDSVERVAGAIFATMFAPHEAALFKGKLRDKYISTARAAIAAMDHRSERAGEAAAEIERLNQDCLLLGKEIEALRSSDRSERAAVIEECVAACEAEPEMDDDPPPEAIAMMKEDPTAMVRATVRVTKRSIIARLRALG